MVPAPVLKDVVTHAVGKRRRGRGIAVRPVPIIGAQVVAIDDDAAGFRLRRGLLLQVRPVLAFLRRSGCVFGRVGGPGEPLRGRETPAWPRGETSGGGGRREGFGGGAVWEGEDGSAVVGRSGGTPCGRRRGLFE